MEGFIAHVHGRSKSPVGHCNTSRDPRSNPGLESVELLLGCLPLCPARK